MGSFIAGKVRLILATGRRITWRFCGGGVVIAIGLTGCRITWRFCGGGVCPFSWSISRDKRAESLTGPQNYLAIMWNFTGPILVGGWFGLGKQPVLSETETSSILKIHTFNTPTKAQQKKRELAQHLQRTSPLNFSEKWQLLWYSVPDTCRINTKIVDIFDIILV